MKSLIIDTREYGFFSSVFQVLDNIEYCNQNNIKPIIRLGNAFRYKSINNNAWNNFFQDVNDNIAEGEIIHIYQLPNGALYLLTNYLLVDPLNHNYKSVLWENLINNPEIAKQHRLQIHNNISKYLKPNDYVQQIVDDFYQKNFNDAPILGVHFRGTDFGYSNTDIFISTINHLINQYAFSKIYIASDNQEAISLINNAFPTICCYYDTPYRATSMSNNNMSSMHLFLGEDMIRHGQSVLVESILLSKCDRLVCINSNISKFASYLNPNMPIDLITRLENQG